MNPPRCNPDLYVRFLCAASGGWSGVELSKVAPEDMAHDAVSRMLSRGEISPESVWRQAEPLVSRQKGYLLVDDTVVDKPYAEKIELVRWQYSGTHHDVVKGIGVITLLWTDGEKHVPIDFRVYDPDGDGKTKNQHFRDMLATALERGFTPACVLFDCWYASLENLKKIRKLKWMWLTQLKKNRIVDYSEPLETKQIPPEGLRVHLRKYGFILVFRTDAPNGTVKYWATSNEELSIDEFDRLRRTRWRIENYHRGLKQHCGVSRCQSRSRTSQITHIAASILAFIKLEITRLAQKLSWHEQKQNITRNAIRCYLTRPSTMSSA